MENTDLKAVFEQMTTVLTTLTQDRLQPQTNTTLVPKFEQFDRNLEPWEQYLQRFEQHLTVYNVGEAQRKACLLSWVGPETYQLIMNLCGGIEGTQNKTYTDIAAALTNHYQKGIHVQAARYRFYNCEMKNGQTYSDWAAELRGLGKDCMFKCQKTGCGESYLDEQIRDVIIKQTPHPDIRRQCLLDNNPSLQDILQKATNYIRTTETDTMLKERTLEVNRTQPAQRYPTKPRARYKGCPSCFTAHSRRECPYKSHICKKCSRKGHLSSVCMSRDINAIEENELFSEATGGSESAHSVFHLDRPVVNQNGKQIWFKTKLNNKPTEMQWDTGATCSMINRDTYHTIGTPPITASNITLKSYGNTTIKVIGECVVNVVLGNKTVSNLKLLIVDLADSPNLFGMDWSHAFGLLDSGLSAVNQTETVMENARQVQSLNGKVELLKAKYPEIFKPGLGICTTTKIPLYLRKDAQPHFSNPRDIPFTKRNDVKAELERLETEGVIRKLHYSDWAAPIVCVSKPNGKVRICGDFKHLNRQLHIDQHPIPKIDELMAKLGKGEHFSKIDLADAYLQLELEEEAKKLCVINTPFGLFQYQRMCFGIASSPAQFQRYIDTIVSDLPGVAAYMDDLIITGPDENTHWTNLHSLLDRLKECGFRVRLEKCQFFQSQVEYLGHIIDNHGKRPSETATTAIQEMPAPKDVSQVQAFLGKVNYYGRFIPNLSTKAAPLNSLLRQDAKFEWQTEQQKAFDELKNDIVSATKLAHYDMKKELILATDASSYGIGAVLMQKEGNAELPIAHASKTLNQSQRNYSQIDREALSIIYGITKFRQYLYGRKFTLVTDHEPLTHIFSPDKAIPTLAAQRLQRWAIALRAYQYDIRYKPTTGQVTPTGFHGCQWKMTLSLTERKQLETMKSSMLFVMKYVAVLSTSKMLSFILVKIAHCKASPST